MNQNLKKTNSVHKTSKTIVDYKCYFVSKLTYRARYEGEIWKHIFISTIFGLPSTLICYENRAFWKRSSNLRNLKTLALRFSVNGKHFANKAFRKRWRHDHRVISVREFSSKSNPKWSVFTVFSNFPGVVWRESIWYAFRVKTPSSNFSGLLWTWPRENTFFP